MSSFYRKKRSKAGVIKGQLILYAGLLLLCETAFAGQVTASVFNKSDRDRQHLVSVHFEKEPLPDVLHKLARKVKVGFSYKSEVVPAKQITYQAINKSIFDILNAVLEGTGLYVELSENRKVILIKQKKEFESILFQEVTGKVTDAALGEPLPGVNIVVKGTLIGTSTDRDGNYQLNVPSLSDTLVFTFIGYETREVPINGRAVINITMQPQTISGQQLVVVGYSTQKKEDLTGSVAVVNIEEMTGQASPQVAKQLQGYASGVTVVSSGQPGEQPMVNIRGFNTFGNNTPLYVIDGVPTQNISSLNPNDIASMQVMKDAGAASIYGSRAANGVIIITTKKGGKGISVDYSAYYGWQVPKRGNVWDILSPQEMAELEWTALRNSGVDPTPDPVYGNGDTPVLPDYVMPAGASVGDPSVNPSLYNVNPNYTNPDELNNFYSIIKANKSGTNWYQEIFSPAPMSNNNLTVSGGGDLGTFLLSFNYLNQVGTLMETYLKRYSFRVNTQYDITNSIRVGENMSYSVSNNPRLLNSLNSVNPIGMSYRMQPIIPVYDIMGNFAGSNGDAPGAADNPVGMMYRTRNNRTQDNRFFGNVFAEVDVLDNMTVRTSFGGTLATGSSLSIIYPEYENTLNNTTNEFSQSSSYGHNWTWTNMVTYQNTFNNLHSFQVILGTEAFEAKARGVGGTTQGYFIFDPDFMNLSTGAGTKTNFSYSSSRGLFSLIGRLDYSYDEKYLLSATLRRDGSSKFTTNRFGWFPAVSVGWRVSQESFMRDISWITDLKIRGGYGIMGNQLNVAVDNAYTLFTGSEISSYYDIAGTSSDIVQGFMKQRIGNSDAKWEQNVNANIGIDVTLFDGRLQMTADYYRKDIRDLLYNPDLLGAAGNAAAPFVNVGNIENMGLDASLEGRGTIAGDLNYNATLTFTTYHNEIVKIAEGEKYFDLDSSFFGTTIVRNAVGHPVSSYYGYQIIGFWDDQSEIDNANAGSPSGTYQEDIQIGSFRYQDTNGDGQVTPEDRVFLGNPHPDFTYGFNLGLYYKNFDFSIFLYGVQGNEIWNNVKWFTDFATSFQGARSHTALYDSWRPDNKDAAVSRLGNTGSFSTNGVPNSYYVEDGSYLRAKNLVIGYTLPLDLVQKISIDKLRVYVQAANLFTLTGYSGTDPEIGGSGTTHFGVDDGAYASPQQFLVGIDLSF